MSKVVKQMMIGSIQSDIGDHREILVIDTSRLDGVTVNKLRNHLRTKDIRMLAVKNAVATKALSEIGLLGIRPSLRGPSTLVFGGGDIVALSREISEWAQKIKTLEIRGGAVGHTSLAALDVQILSKSPGRKELLSQIVGIVLSPGRRLVGAISSPAAVTAGQLEMIVNRATD